MTGDHKTLTGLERAVLELLLERSGPEFEALRLQLAEATVVKRKLTGVGFFTTVSVPGELAAPAWTGKSPFGDVEAEIDGLAHGAGFLLWLKDGRLDFLEGYSYDEPWPERIGRYTLRRVEVAQGRG